MKNLNFTQEQINEILVEISEKKDGLDLLLKHALEAMMRGEREEYKTFAQDMSNGYRPRRTYGRGKMLELRVPRTRNGSFYPLILGLLRDQEEEARKIAFTLYGAGMTTEQVGEVFGDLYGKEYSTSQVSRMFDYARKDVAEWLKRPLESYYPILFIDATFISTRREDHVSKEAYYTILGVRADRTREVLAIVNFPTESASAWIDIFVELRNRGVESTNLVVSDSLAAIEDSVWRVYPEAEVQLCVVHLERNVQKRIKPADKAAVGEDFREVFRTDDSSDKPEKGWARWQWFTEKWGKKYPSIKSMGENERYKLHFTYLGFDYRMRPMIYTTNWIERLNRDYKRTTRMRGALPNPEATMLLLGHVAMNRKAYLRKVPKLNYETRKFAWQEEG
ncbi:MAG: hypothetical protein A2W93_14760 [Bacteroidetes bacterium GWF2_43_63]|nr:MAG: hypothetical protein A2W94_01330 [Bacteroidetes bacterium GWE2_42_42]OFY52600.1 MAG: hypothetical protein A2W93_14760 [Bacteroidetes bacterium GWF2_43_63]